VLRLVKQTGVLEEPQTSESHKPTGYLRLKHATDCFVRRTESKSGGRQLNWSYCSEILGSNRRPRGRYEKHSNFIDCKLEVHIESTILVEMPSRYNTEVESRDPLTKTRYNAVKKIVPMEQIGVRISVVM